MPVSYTHLDVYKRQIYDYNINTDDEPNPNQGFNIFEERANTNKETVTSAVDVYKRQLSAFTW